MDRRDLLKSLAFGAGSLLIPKFLRADSYTGPKLLRDTKGIQAGWFFDEKARDQFIKRHRYPFISQQNREIRDTGAGKVALWWPVFEKVTRKPFVPHDQGIGDCVSHGFGLGVDFLTTIQIEVQKKPEKWMGKCATEVIYGGSRIEIGNIPTPQRFGDGSTGYWAGEWVSKYGILLRQPYPGGYDFTEYDPYLAREYGRTGVPDALEPVAKLHPVKTVALVTSWEECRDAIYNGHLVAMCSNIGFGETNREWVRDRDGFLRRKRIPWWHCMLLAGIDDKYRRPGALCINSWGSHWVTGPTRHNQPLGSFWIDAETIDTAMKQGDSMALSNYIGYPKVIIPDYVIW
jgi:hypothetical protein